MLITRSGRRVNPLDLQIEDISIEDIAWALSNINRFGGHPERNVNVAMHSVTVMLLCPPEDRLQALLHDAPEAYLGDVNYFLKRTPAMAAYREAEDRAWERICKCFGCEVELTPSVKTADWLATKYEGERVYGPLWAPPDRWLDASEVHQIQPWWDAPSAAASRVIFLDAFRELRGARRGVPFGQ